MVAFRATDPSSNLGRSIKNFNKVSVFSLIMTRVLNSESHLSALSRISEEKDGMRCVELEKELDFSPQYANRILNKLQDEDILNQLSDKRYVLDPKGLADFWIREVEKSYYSHRQKDRLKEDYQRLQDEKAEVRTFLENTLTFMLQEIDPDIDATVEDLIFKGLSSDIQETLLREDLKSEKEEFLNLIIKLAGIQSGLQYHYEAVEEALSSMERR
jgi:AAA+ ATPase superfamily predicted ATPase